MFHILLAVNEAPGSISVSYDLGIEIVIIVYVLIFSLFLTWSRLVFYQQRLKKLERSAGDMLRIGWKLQREGIAKNIHDDINTLLTVIKLNLTKVYQHPDEPQISKKLIKENLELMDETICIIRNIAKGLSPPTLAKMGYQKGIEEFCKKINDPDKIRIQFKLSENEVRLCHSKELQLYRITMEVLTNIIRHSGVTDINISLNSSEKGVTTTITYYGFGITTEKADELSETGKGCGLKSIKQRAEDIGATINYIMIEVNEFKVIIDVPTFKKHEKHEKHEKHDKISSSR